jgi:hypothetical protein
LNVPSIRPTEFVTLALSVRSDYGTVSGNGQEVGLLTWILIGPTEVPMLAVLVKRDWRKVVSAEVNLDSSEPYLCQYASHCAFEEERPEGNVAEIAKCLRENEQVGRQLIDGERRFVAGLGEGNCNLEAQFLVVVAAA